MRPDVYRDLLADLLKLNAPDDYKQMFEALIRSRAMQNGVKSLQRDDRVRLARKLLDTRHPRPIIRDRLMSLYGISKAQAYVDIEDALKTVQ